MSSRIEIRPDEIHILVVDDDEAVRLMIQQIIQYAGYNCSIASSGEEALSILDHMGVDVVVTDFMMPGLDGIELIGRVQEKCNSDVIVMTGNTQDLTYEKVISRGASDFIQKPMRQEELLVRLKRVLRERYLLEERNRVNEELHHSIEKLQRVLEETVSALTSAVEMKDPYTSGHQRRVTQLAVAMAELIGLSEGHIAGIRIAGQLHDVGKISIPAEILSKPGRLSEAEFALLKGHPETGYEILKRIEFQWPVAQIVYQHHEKIDGSGYPQGLKGDLILLEARIITVADVVEAMSSHRPYRPALGIDRALEEVYRHKGNFFDPMAVDACITLFREQGFTFS